MKEIILVGGGGHCKSVIDVIELENKYKIIGVIDKKELIGSKVLDYDVIGCDDDLGNLCRSCKYAVITVGQTNLPTTRISLFEKLVTTGFILPFIVSSRAYISKYAFIGEGTVVMHDVLVNASAKIGRGCIINTKALIEHDAIIEDNCHVSTGAIVNGGVIVKANTFYGSNATSKQCAEVSGFIKAGSVVK